MTKSDHRSEVLAGLLGPGQPEIGCERCFEELDRYVEFEVAGADAETKIPGMQAHLEGCSACAQEYESLKDLIASSKPPD
jgi:hypothetical protein